MGCRSSVRLEGAAGTPLPTIHGRTFEVKLKHEHGQEL
jgi:hypothetical protein